MTRLQSYLNVELMLSVLTVHSVVWFCWFYYIQISVTEACTMPWRMYWQSERQKQLHDLKKRRNLNPSYRADKERRDGAWGFESYLWFRDLAQFSIKYLKREIESNVITLNSKMLPFLFLYCSQWRRYLPLGVSIIQTWMSLLRQTILSCLLLHFLQNLHNKPHYISHAKQTIVFSVGLDSSTVIIP